MRKSMIILCVSVTAFLVLIATIGVLATNNGLWFHKEETTDAYVFPITSGGTPDKWKELQTHEKMESACQIPEKVLKSISTKGLIETCLNYPLFADMYAYNSNMQGVEAVTSGFNGFQELDSRSDAAKELLDYYKNIDYGKLDNSNDSYYAIRFRFFNYYMSQDKVLLKLSADERQELLKACKEKFGIIKEKYSNILSNDSIIYVAARTMQIDDENVRALIGDKKYYENSMEKGEMPGELAELILPKLGFNK